MAEQTEVQRERDYVLLRFDGHAYKRAAEVNAKSPDEALDEWVAKNNDDAGQPFMVVPKRFTELRRVRRTMVPRHDIETVDEKQAFDVPLPYAAEEPASD